MAKEFIFLVCETNTDGIAQAYEAHSTKEGAEAAASAMKEEGSKGIKVRKLELQSGANAAASKGGKGKAATNTKGRPAKKAKEPEPEDDDDDDENGAEDDEMADEEAPKPKKGASKQAKDERKAIPEGKPNCLEGLKLLFTGTMDMDRNTCKATAEKYGATVITKLEDTDYIILGTKPGPKKLETIEEHNLDTLSVDEFLAMLKNGVPQAKLDSVAAKAANGEPAKKKQKK